MSLENYDPTGSGCQTSDEAAEAELEALALEGLNSGELIVADDRYRAEKRRRLIERSDARQTRYGVAGSQRVINRLQAKNRYIVAVKV